MTDCSGKPAAKKFLIDGFWFGGKKSEGYLRGRTIMSDADRPSSRVGNLNDVTRLRVASLGNITRKNPRVPARNPVNSLSIHANGSQPAILA
jgi:hypothetical protein